ncbi:MAG: CvpA family protein [Paenibacillaceae bacterium]|nr:CvpA family protein [Paenibacillaceae bacterium]
MNTYDAIVLGVSVWGVWRGWHRGLYTSIAIMLALIAALAVSWFWATPASQYVQAHTALDDGVRSFLGTKMGLDFVAQHIDSIRTWWNAAHPAQSGESLSTLADQATAYVMMAVCAVGLFLGAWIAGRMIFGVIASVMSRVPVLDAANHVGGSVAGGVWAVTVVLLLSAVLQLLLDPAGQWGKVVHASWTVETLLPMCGVGWTTVIEQTEALLDTVVVWKG